MSTNANQDVVGILGFPELNFAIDAHSIVSMTDEFGTITYVNDHFCAISGYSRHELLGQNHRVLKSTAHARSFYIDLWSTIRAGRTWSGVIQNRRKDGKAYWVQSTILPLSAVQGGRSGYISIRTDITTRERMRMALELIARQSDGREVLPVCCEALATATGASAAGILEFVDNNEGFHVLSAWPTPLPSHTVKAIANVGNTDIRIADRSLSRPDGATDKYAEAFPSDLHTIPITAPDGSAFGMAYVVDGGILPDDDGVKSVINSITRRAYDTVAHQRNALKSADQSAWVDFVIRGSGAGVWDWDIETGAIQMNDRCAAMLGYAPGEIDGSLTGWSALTHPDDRAGTMAAARKHLAGDAGAYSREFRLKRKDGLWTWVISQGMVTARKADGAPLRMSGINLDISAERAAKDALETERRRLALVIANTPIGLWEADLDAGTVHASTEWLEKLGYTGAQIPRTRPDWELLVHPDDKQLVRDTVRRCISGEILSYSVEYRLIAPTGQCRTVLSRGFASERGADGGVRKLAGIHIDISERKAAEVALAESKARIRAIVDNAPLGIFSADAAGRLGFMNGWIRENFRWSEARNLGELWYACVSPAEWDGVTDTWARFIGDSATTYDAELRMVVEEGDERITRVRIVKILLGSDLLGFSGVIEDVTRSRELDAEKQRMRVQLEHAHKMEAIGKLAGGIAHDFNNILAIIVGYSSLAQQYLSKDSSPKIKDHIATVLNAAERGRILIEKLLAFSRGTQSPNQSDIDCAQASRDVIELLRPLLPSNIILHANARGSVPLAHMDGADLNQVLFNLIMNARDAISEHGEITVTVGSAVELSAQCASCHAPIAGNFVSIVVSDNGVGIAEAELLSVFDPFFSTKEVGKGTGLGLSVVHGIVHEAGGHITMDSAIGVGTTITVFLPARSIAMMGTGDAGSDIEHSVRDHALRVLVVDDESRIRTYLADLLSSAGMTVQTAPNGRRALELFKAVPESVDLIFSDLTMPEMNGIELIECARRISPHIPAVLTSGYRDSLLLDRTTEMNIHFLRKPATADEIFAAIQASTHAPQPKR